MVRLLILLFLSTVAHAETRLAMEFTKSKIYQGESVTCHFVLYSPEARLEVEVSKFPEFRGFWSENTLLRQNDVFLLPEPRFPGMRRAVIGSYTLLSMMGDNPPSIQPMKILVRSRGLGAPEESVFLSEGPPLNILPLPPVPATDKPYFTGGVGTFTLRSEAPLVRFYAEDPTSLRYFVTGSGNFPEINTLNLPLPPEVKLVSQRSYTAGTGTYQSKAFEFTVSTGKSAVLEIPPMRLVFFNPNTGRYESTSSDAVKLEALERPMVPDVQEAIELGPVQASWSSRTPLERNPLFLGFQIFLAALWTGLVGRRWLRKRAQKRAADPWEKLKLRWKQLFQDKSAVAETWMIQADTLLFDTLQARSRRPLVTRRDAIAFADRIWGNPTAAVIAGVFQTQERSRFMPPPRPEIPLPEELEPRLKALRKTLFSRKRPKRTAQEHP